MRQTIYKVLMWGLRTTRNKLLRGELCVPPAYLQIEWWGEIRVHYPRTLVGRVVKKLDDVIEVWGWF